MAIPRTAWTWGVAYAMMWMTVSLAAGSGPPALVRLSGRTDWSGVYFATFLLVSASGALLGGRLLARYDRRRVWTGAHLIGAGGYALVGWADGANHLPLFVTGLVALAAAFGCTNLVRAVGAELFGPEGRARGVAFLQSMAAIGAFAGPLVLIVGGLAERPMSIAWAVAPVALAVAAIAVARTGPGPARPPVGTPTAAISWSPILAPAAVLILSQVAMMAPMSLAGAALHHHGYGPVEIGGALLLHFAGMFALAPIVGRVADRKGRTASLWSGVALLAAGGIALWTIPGWLGYAVSLVAVGFGWCFAFVTCTAVVADQVPIPRRPTVLGKVDVGVALAAASVSLLAGGVWTYRGEAGLGALVLLTALLAAAVLLVRRVRGAPLTATPAPGPPTEVAPGRT